MINIDQASHDLALMCVSEIPLATQNSAIRLSQIAKKLAKTYFDAYNLISNELNALTVGKTDNDN